MTQFKYEVAFYQNKRFTGITPFNDITEASEHLLACIERYMESHGFFVNMDSSYCVCAFDLSQSERMIQLLGPIDDNTKMNLQNKFADINMKWAQNILNNK
jgi:hypothetical protein